MRRCVVVSLVSVALPLVLLGRQSALDFGRWKNFTDMKVVRGMASTTDSIWVATSGGLFLYTPSSNRFLKFTNSDGLSSNDLTAVAIDGGGRVWVGSSDGFLNALTPRTGEWEEVRSIEESDRVQKSIRTLLVHGDSLFIGTDFGVSVLQISRIEFRDTYANLGFATQAGANAISIYQNRIWVATDLGVASAPINAANLSAPTSWTDYGTADGLSAGSCTSMTLLHDTIFVGTSNGLAVFDGKKFSPVAAFNSKNITGVLSRTNDVVVLWSEGTGFALGAYSGIGGPIVPIATNTDAGANALAGQPLTSTVWVGTDSKGIGRLNGAWEYKAPNGPQSNLFSSIVVDDRGVLWAASGISGRGRGFYRYDPAASDSARWRNFTAEVYPVMKTDDYYKVSLGTSGTVWVSGWGPGLLQVLNDSIQRHLDQTTKPALVGSVAADTNYVVIGGVAVDSKGDSWLTDRTAVNGKHVIQFRSDGSTLYRTSPSEGKFTNLVIDRNSTKWFANSEPTDKPADGLYYFNENDTLVAGTSTSGGWGQMTTDDGPPSNIILSLALDLDGNVCVGTDLGLTIITDPLNPKINNSTNYTRLPLRGQSIQAIAIDAVNNKWVGTKEGVIVVNSDATQVIEQYTVLSTNGKLVDDDVRSIAFDQQRGIVYVGTEKGLSSLEVTPVQTARTLSSLQIGPNPFVVPSSQPLTIRNLVSESTIKIISIDGRLISEFAAQAGGRAFWDGRDTQGDIVPSGIYFVVAYADNGNQTTTAKVAVIRR